MKYKWAAVLSTVSVVLSLNAAALAQAPSPAPKTIEVTGHGDSSAKPDMMTLSFAVTSHSESADECTRKESEVSNRVVDALKSKLGDSVKVTTSDFSFNPSIEYGNATATPTVMRAEEPPATWEFKADLNVFAGSMAPLADLIETGMAAGATSVSQSGRGQMPYEPDESPAAATGTTSGAVSSSFAGGVEYRQPPAAFFVRALDCF